MTVRFRRNPAVHAELRATPQFAAAMNANAAEVAHQAEFAAPDQTGHYRRSIKQVGSTVGTTDIAGHIVEWGSVNNPPYAPLRRGVLAAGLRLDDRQI